MIEVPPNSPRPLASIDSIVAKFGAHALIGASTVLDVASVDILNEVGARLVVSPNFSADVVKRSVDLRMVSLPGVLTPTEMFAAYLCGASGIKDLSGRTFIASRRQGGLAALPSGFRGWRNQGNQSG